MAITVGSISSSNPTLWVEGTNFADYVISTSPPPGTWYPVNQFCSLLTLHWLQGGRGTSPYGLDHFKDAEKIAMAQILIGYTSLQSQVDYAASQLGLGGKQEKEATVKDGVEKGAYKVGTKIWTGNDQHVLGVYIVDATQFDLYDSNTGLTKSYKRTDFGKIVKGLGCNVFVVRSA